eukprot:9555091-Ditylum_brightwellii.AAC.1
MALGGPTLQVRQANNDQMIDIEYKTPYTPHKTLGHYKTPGGHMLTQQHVLNQTTTRYAIRAMTSAPTHSKAHMHFDSCYCRSVGYVLGQLFFMTTELQTLESKAIQAFTSKLGYNRNMAYVIRESPYQFGGAAIALMVDIQGIKQIKNSETHAHT